MLLLGHYPPPSFHSSCGSQPFLYPSRHPTIYSLPFISPSPSLRPSARRDEEEAARALQGMQGRYYAGKPIVVEFSPVTDFREATCRQYEENNCSRGGYCNFMHVRPVSRELRKQVRRAAGQAGGGGARAGGGG